MRSLLLLAVFGLVGWTMARTIRIRASRSPAVKNRMLIGGCLSLALGLVIALWLPGRVPETQGSPATLGALFARPPADDPTKPASL